jgi:(p)ppGpp synthase/HD superfamily hydrolase
MNIMAERKINVNAAKVKTAKGEAIIDFTIEVAHLNEFKDLVKKIQTIGGVQRIFRSK